MVFSSALFLLYFLPVFLLVYAALPKVLKNWWILSASIFFYAWGAPQFVFILIGSTIIDYFIVRQIDKNTERKKKRLFLIISIAMNLGLLAYFKYANFFIENVNALLDSVGADQLTWTQVVLPIGISFYTFQTLTYSIDVYRGVHKPLKHLHNYLLYIMSFPQMIAGPIVRFNSIADQIVERKDTIDDKLLGFFRFCIGLAKKVLIANVLGEVAADYLELSPDKLTFASSWVGIIAYTFQIYFDFAGYSDMAIGLGKMMGFTFPENFNNPYTSRSITEFWRRWHMTLGDWMKNYLYIPLGGNKVSSKGRLFFNLWFVFLVSGLWHGASWNFVIWGAYHGLFLILDRLFLRKILDRIGVIPSVLFTFFVAAVGWVFFSIESFEQSSAYLNIMFSFDNWSMPELSNQFIWVMILTTFISFITLLKVGKSMEAWIYRTSSISLSLHLLKTIVAVALFFLCVSAITTEGFNPFIYFRF